MPSVIYVQPDGMKQTVEVAEGLSVMQGAMLNNIAGIRAECGGGCACATCHVYVDEAWRPRLSEADEIETQMLEGVAAGRGPGSRLSCRIVMSPPLCGLVVHLPEEQ